MVTPLVSSLSGQCPCPPPHTSSDFFTPCPGYLQLCLAHSGPTNSCLTSNHVRPLSVCTPQLGFLGSLKPFFSSSGRILQLGLTLRVSAV